MEKGKLDFLCLKKIIEEIEPIADFGIYKSLTA